MLLNITPIGLGDDASPNLWNSRFAAVQTVLNGNVDSDNLKDGAVTRSKIAAGAIDSSKIDIQKYVDANGWTVTDFGGTKTYSYTYVIAGVSMPGLARKDNLPTIQPPVGRTRDNLVFSVTWYGGYSGHALPGVEAGAGTSIAVMFGNLYSTNLTFTGNIYITAVEKV